MNQEKIGKFIAELRKEKKWTQEDLAQKLIVDRGTVSKWERGVYIPNTEILLKLQDLFNVSINEILYGERRNKNNKKNVDNVTIEILKSNKKKIKKIITVSFLIVFSIAVCFLFYYFFNNYNSISVYRIYGGDDNYYIRDGLMIVSKEKSYIKLGRVINNTDEKIDKIRLYFMNDDKEDNIFTGDVNDSDELFINKFDYNELFKYSDLNYIKKGLFLEITFESNNKFIIELKVKKDFSNDKLFDEIKSEPISDGNKNTNDSTNIPNYIKNNFKYDKKEEKYYKETENIKEEYFVELNLYILNKKSNRGNEHYEYYFLDKSITYYLLKDNNITNNFSYNLTDEKCAFGECNLSLVNEFLLNYIKKYDFD